MGKKDAQANPGKKDAHQASPVDKYRKQIGKDNNKKNKKDVKEAKKKSELKKSAMPIKEVILMLLSLVVIVAGVYIFFYWYLGEHMETATFHKSEV